MTCGGGGGGGGAGVAGAAGDSVVADGAEPTGRPGSCIGGGGSRIRCRSMAGILGCSVIPV